MSDKLALDLCKTLIYSANKGIYLALNFFSTRFILIFAFSASYFSLTNIFKRNIAKDVCNIPFLLPFRPPQLLN